ncbi:serine/threonine protein kinase [Streptomyces sp. ASQP_92]|uniref:serine/threonine-protein kinase n=1 Tax=Streptomyces sp. ASQP_92 TaxID=2979116 RepID=UPI0021C1AE80|nr:serine/threonine-protein kinase [Streptomyces sp. ASQP_92]MCT9091715.1 serine/threonine protein kinase [Streptomyces sp. ASQP_92]
MEPLDERDPRAVGGYRVLGRLGEGGMGRVYLARTPGGRSVALKLIHSDMAALPGFRDRFRREVDVVRRVAGVGTVPVVDAGVDEQHPWYASHYLPGPSLQDAVETFGPLSEQALWRFAADLAQTLEHVHGKSLVHRDLKPSNVLLSTSGPRLIDFGIVHAALDTGLTLSGARIGTPAYMSPEQAYGERVTAASDIYSYGLTLAFAATGITPRRGTRPDELGGVGPEFTLLISHCLDHDPERRPTAAELHVRARALDTTGDTWLPAAVASAIARTSEELLNLEAQDDLGQARVKTEPDPGPDPGAGRGGGVGDEAWRGGPASGSGSGSGSGRPGAPSGGPEAPFFGPGAFHGAATQGAGPSRPSTPPPPPPPGTPPPYSSPYSHSYSYSPDSGFPMAARDHSWVYGGLLGRPLFALFWLLPLGIGSYLVVFAEPSFMGWVRVIAVPGLLALCARLTAGRRRMPIGQWCRMNQVFWLVLAFFEVQGWWGISTYNAMGVAARHHGVVTSYQNLVDSLNGMFSFLLALGSLAMIYVVPAVFARRARAVKEGL